MIGALGLYFGLNGALVSREYSQRLALTVVALQWPIFLELILC